VFMSFWHITVLKTYLYMHSGMSLYLFVGHNKSLSEKDGQKRHKHVHYGEYSYEL
jgi:hypothetical protein